MENQFYLLNEKLSDNPFFKNNGKHLLNNNNNNDLSEDIAVSLKAFEKKAMKKFEFLDERNKLNDDELAKIKIDMFSMKNGNDHSHRNFDGIKSELDGHEFKLNEIIKQIRILEEKKISQQNFEEKLKIHNQSIEKQIEGYI